MSRDSDYEFDRRTILKATGVASAAGALGGVAAATPDRSASPKEDEVLVGVSAGYDLVETVAPAVPEEAAIVHQNRGLRYVAAKFPDAGSVAQQNFLESVQNRDGVKYAEINATHETHYVPNDPKFDQQYAPQQVQADDAWDTILGCSDTKIFVVDQGIQYDHSDLEENMCGIVSKHGTDVVDGDSDPYPDNLTDEYHGTHVGGTASGVINDGEGIAGIGNCPVCNCRALDETGAGSTSDIADCIKWAADQGADVINLSLGGGGYNDTMKNAVSYAYDKGCLLVAAAGGDGSDSVSYPAAYSECMAISAVDSSENLASFSNYGSEIELCAPGVDILSTTTDARGSYEKLSGTSMAAPIVSGVACLTNCQWSLTKTELRSHLKDTAKDVGLSSDKQGSGQVNAYNAVTTDPSSGDSTSGSVSDSLSGSSDYDCWSWTWEYSSPSQIDVELSGPSDADFDLYTSEGETDCPGPNDYDQRSISTNSQESISISNPDTSTDLQICVDSYSGSGSYDLTITEYQ